MNHAIKEQISDNTLYVEVELPSTTDDEYFKKYAHCGEESLKATLIADSQISSGDTVYRGEEWVAEDTGGPDCAYFSFPMLASRIVAKYYYRADPTDITAREFFDETQPPQTMPIELAGKTFKVLGIEVELMPRHVASPDKPLADCDYRDLDEAWFWKYSLEKIN